jgi:hypothetical protein
MSDFKLCQSCCVKENESLEIIILMENFSNMNSSASYSLSYWGDQAPKLPGSNIEAQSKGLVSQELISEILRNIKKSNLTLKAAITIYIYKNDQWVPAILSPKTINGVNNTISLMHYPYYKSPPNDNDPIGVKTNGNLASEANQDYSFASILSEGLPNNILRTAQIAGLSFDRRSNPSHAFIRGTCFSKYYCNNINNHSTLTDKGSFFTFFKISAGSNAGKADIQKIYYSTNSGYVDTAYYQNNQWPAGFGDVTEEDIPNSNFFTSQYPWNYEYFPRIPESEKNKIGFRDIKIAFADFNNYYNKDKNAEDCVPYYNNFDEQTDFPLCYPNCLKDPRTAPQPCPEPSFLRATEATATIQNGQVTSISIDPELKGFYNCAPTIQIIAEKSGVGALAFQRDGEKINDNNYVNFFKPSNAPEIISNGFGYTTPPEVNYQRVFDETSIFSEDFSSIQNGSNTNINYSNWTGWEGNQNFPRVNNAFQAGGAVYLSGASSYIETKNINLNFPVGNFAISFDVKGRYSSVEPPNNILKIQVTGSTNVETNISYTSAINDQFESKYVEFTVSKNKNIKFSPAGTGELFLTNIKVYGPGDAAAGYERGWILRSDFTKNFDDIYAAMPYYYLREGWQHGVGSPYPASIAYGSPSQGLSAIKNACLKFSSTSKKMIIFVADNFLNYQGTLNEYTDYRADISYGLESSPYPTKEEIKNLLSEKDIRLHAISFYHTRLPFGGARPEEQFYNLSKCLQAYAPLNNIGLGYDDNTIPGYVSAIEEITNSNLDLYNSASGNKLWLLRNLDGIPRAQFARDKSTIYNGVPNNFYGGRVLPAPTTVKRAATGIFNNIKAMLGEISGSY